MFTYQPPCICVLQNGNQLSSKGYQIWVLFTLKIKVLHQGQVTNLINKNAFPRDKNDFGFRQVETYTWQWRKHVHLYLEEGRDYRKGKNTVLLLIQPLNSNLSVGTEREFCSNWFHNETTSLLTFTISYSVKVQVTKN